MVETAPYKYPRKIALAVTLPETVSGKIRRVGLRERQKKLGSENAVYAGTNDV